jgi:hypothetical protein
MRPPTNLHVIINFWPQKMLQPFITPPPHAHTQPLALYLPGLSPRDYFLFPYLKMKLKGLNFADVTEIQEVVTDESTKLQKRWTFGSFS